jgi:hypothetical protein
MEFQKIKDLKTLYLIRQDLFNGEYVLTDHQNNFGKLTYDGLARETADIASYYGNWKLDYDFELFGNSQIMIYDDTNLMLREIIVGYNYPHQPPSLAMTDGFTATFSKSDLWSDTYQWKSNISGSLIHIKNAIFSMTNTITVIDNNIINEEKITLLSFLAQHLLILKSRRKQGSY